MAVLLESLFLKIVALVAAVHFFHKKFRFWKKRGILYAKPWPFVGNIKDSALQNLDVGQNLKQIHDENKDKSCVGFFSFDQPSFLINDVDFVKCVLEKDAQNFVNRVQTSNEGRSSGSQSSIRA
jgi:hypothetical protein